jgi:MOSC domain-containing protein YiiM
MQEGRIVNLHLARAKGAPSTPVKEAVALLAQGLEGDRSCKLDNPRQLLLVDQETLQSLELKPGQIKENITTSGLDLSEIKEGQTFLIGMQVILKIGGHCDGCSKLNDIRPGLQSQLRGRRGVMAMVTCGGPIKVGDPIRIEA